MVVLKNVLCLHAKQCLKAESNAYEYTNAIILKNSTFSYFNVSTDTCDLSQGKNWVISSRTLSCQLF